ncbi:MAG: CocE/NonD family hydrolase [Acidimicrobiales bacterium]
MNKLRAHSWIRAASTALLLAAVACSSGDDSSGGDSSAGADDAAAASGDEVPASRTCDQGASQDRVEAAPVAGTPSDHTITSFDGTRIRAHWFPAPTTSTGERAPTMLMGPGWSLPGATLAADGGDGGDGGTNPVSSGALDIGRLNEAGYNVLTWDPRGFGASTGTVTVNDPDHEGRDVQVLLDWVATQHEARLDTQGDPRAGMVGASYGGGIQLTVAGIDCRVDALVPNVAWHSLETSLFRNETVKAGWARLLDTAAAGADRDPHLVEAADAGLTTGVLDDDMIEWFRDRGPGDLVDQITAPTLLVHGTVDTLFTPGEAVANFTALRSAGTPVAMLWYCGGHGACLTDPGDPAIVTERTLAWLDHYLHDNPEADTGPVVDIVDQDGRRWVGDDLPDGADDPLTARGDGGALALTADSVAGPITPAGSDDILAGLVAGFTPGRADRAVEMTLEADRDALVLGAPRVTLTYRGTTPDGPEPTRMFAQLVDDESGGHVFGNQITPVPLTLDGDEHTAQVDLEVVAHHLVEGARVILQLVATTPAYATPRLGGELTVTDIALELPTTDDLSPAPDD